MGPEGRKKQSFHFQGLCRRAKHCTCKTHTDQTNLAVEEGSSLCMLLDQVQDLPRDAGAVEVIQDHCRSLGRVLRGLDLRGRAAQRPLHLRHGGRGRALEVECVLPSGVYEGPGLGGHGGAHTANGSPLGGNLPDEPCEGLLVPGLHNHLRGAGHAALGPVPMGRGELRHGDPPAVLEGVDVVEDRGRRTGVFGGEWVVEALEGRTDRGALAVEHAEKEAEAKANAPCEERALPY